MEDVELKKYCVVFDAQSVLYGGLIPEYIYEAVTYTIVEPPRHLMNSKRFPNRPKEYFFTYSGDPVQRSLLSRALGERLGEPTSSILRRMVSLEGGSLSVQKAMAKKGYEVFLDLSFLKNIDIG